MRAFEAAARYKSLVRAADELCVTPTAISHQVRLLEDFLQIKLFDRRNGRLDLTLAGKNCVPELTAGLDQIDSALASIVDNGTRERIVVGASPSVTSLWLLPRLQRFVASVPSVDVILKAVSDHTHRDNSLVDISISSWDAGAEHRVEPLMEEEILPVCAPHLLDRSLSPEEALATLPLIHDDKKRPTAGGTFPTWQRYLADRGIVRADVGQGVRFNQSSLAMEAAIEGYGMLLGRSMLISHALEDGRLVCVAGPYAVRFKYFMISPLNGKSRARDAFRSWLLSEVSPKVPLAPLELAH